MQRTRLTRRAALQLGAAGAFSAHLFRAIRAEAAPSNNQRLAFIFHANGSHHAWTPTGTGAAFTLTPHISGLEPIRNDVIILRKLTMQRGSGNAHKASTLSVLGAGGTTSFDQVMANAWKGQTALPSLELAIGYTSGGGGKAPSLSQVNGVFLPGERNPVAAYQRVTARIMNTGGGAMTADPQAMEKALLARRSVLDYVRGETDSLKVRLGTKEKPKLDLYLDGLRDLEKGLGNYAGEVRAAASCGKTAPQADVGILDAHVQDMPKVSRLFLDTMALALACGVTRVVSMMWGGGESAENIDFVGIRDWHITTHANPSSTKGDACIKMQTYMSGEFAYFVQKLKSFSDGASTLFDNTLAVYGTQNGNTNQTNFAKEDHDRHNTPVILAGRGGGAFKLGRVLDCNDLNHNDLYLAIAQAYGVDLKTVGDATWCKGPLAGVVG